MNTKQKIQVATWIGSLSLVALMIIYNNEILEYWDTIRWPSLAVIIALVAIFKPKDGYKKDPEWINKAAKKYPLLKVWFGVYGILLTGFIYDSLSTGRDLFEYMGGNWAFVAILLLILPAIIVYEREKFISNGKGKNNGSSCFL